MYDKPRLIVDFDGTVTNLRLDGSVELDLNKATPKSSLISQLKALKPTHHLVLYTARGMKRSKGQYHLVADDVKAEVVGWLEQHQLLDLFDELLLGMKPYGELYIDESGIPPQAFVLGITDRTAWIKFCQSAHFATAIQNFNSPPNQLHLPIA